MDITVKIPDELVASYDLFIAKYHGAKWSVYEFVVAQIDALSNQVNGDFPLAETVAIREQIAALKEQAEQPIRSTIISDAPTERTK